jgi:homoisocitrate dehydrogenase
MVIVRENTECLVRNLFYARVCNILRYTWVPQYIKEETITMGPTGKEARATRLITERASRRIGQMAFETALTRGPTVCSAYLRHHCTWLILLE